MANRFPLIIDTADSNKLKELPIGDNLNLSGSGIVNASSIVVNGTITATNISIDGQSFADVAYSGDYNDLSNTPTGFSGEYADLAGKPNIPTITRSLEDVEDIVASDGQVLQWSAVDARYVPTTLDLSTDISSKELNDLNDVIILGVTDNRFLKFTSGAWRASRVSYSELTDKPVNVSSFVNDAEYLIAGNIIESEVQGNIISGDSTVLVNSTNGSVNLDGTVKGNIIPDINEAYDLGSITNRFKDLYLSSSSINLGGTDISVVGGELQLDGDVVITQSQLGAGGVEGAFSGFFNGDFTGSVFSDDSTLLVDGVNGEIPGYIKIADLKTALQDGAGDFAAFKAWVLANL